MTARGKVTGDSSRGAVDTQDDIIGIMGGSGAPSPGLHPDVEAVQVVLKAAIEVVLDRVRAFLASPGFKALAAYVRDWDAAGRPDLARSIADICWRCDVVVGVTPAGLCAECHADLAEPVAS